VAQFDLGLAYDDGVGVEEIDWDKAAYWYECAAKGGNKSAMFNFALLLGKGLIGLESEEKRDREQDKRLAVYWLRKVAKRGDINGISLLGGCYFDGDGVRRNRPLGFKMMQQAAEQGYGLAQYNVSLLYLHGDYVEKDFDKEFFWLQKAVENGCPEAYNNLGVCYSLGRGTQIDHNKAFSLYKKAFRLDPMDEEAANNLAVCYENGEGVEPDPREALLWYRRAKRLGKEGIEEEIERMKRAVKEM
jgi:TPR repeat protein